MIPERTTYDFPSGPRSGLRCENCGMAYDRCTANVLSRSKACCAPCRVTDTHDEKRTETMVGTPESRDDALLGDVIALQEQVKLLTERLDAIEAATAPAAPKRDELADKVIEFMSTLPGVKLTALVVAQNLDEENTKVGTRMQTLANRGVLKTTKEEGRTRMYYWPADQSA